jgi:hypothetical protein
MGSIGRIGIQVVLLARPERDDASDRIVRRNPDSDSIAWDHFDPESAHTPAELCQHFMTGVALYAIQSATMHGDDGSLHIN